MPGFTCAAGIDLMHLAAFLSPLGSIVGQGLLANLLQRLREAERRGEVSIAYAVTQGLMAALRQVLPAAAEAVEAVRFARLTALGLSRLCFVILLVLCWHATSVPCGVH